MPWAPRRNSGSAAEETTADFLDHLIGNCLPEKCGCVWLVLAQGGIAPAAARLGPLSEVNPPRPGARCSDFMRSLGVDFLRNIGAAHRPAMFALLQGREQTRNLESDRNHERFLHSSYTVILMMNYAKKIRCLQNDTLPVGVMRRLLIW